MAKKQSQSRSRKMKERKCRSNKSHLAMGKYEEEGRVEAIDAVLKQCRVVINGGEDD